MFTASDRDHYFEHGYLIKRKVVPETELERIKTGVRRIIDRARSGEGLDLPWINKEKGIPNRIPGMLRPEYFQPEIGDFLEKTAVLDIVERILESGLRYSLFGMLASGDGKKYHLEWHRDAAPVEGPSQMTELLRTMRMSCQINAPLFADSFLKIVPGSHARNTTEEERAALRNDSYGFMPGEITVELEPGDVAFYVANLLHTGFNPEGKFRWTLHAAFWVAGSALWHGERPQLDWVKHAEAPYGPRVRELLDEFVKSAAVAGREPK